MEKRLQYIPAKDPLFYTADVHGNAIARDRMLAIKKIVDDKCGTFVMTIDAVMDQVVPLSDIKNHKMTFKMGETLEEATIAEEFVARGYEKAPFVEAPGEFAVRGGIIDIFPYTQESPYRIELWGDEIDSIRSFDAQSQRSLENLDDVTIYPAAEQPMEKNGVSFLDYFKETETLFFWTNSIIWRKMQKLCRRNFSKVVRIERKRARSVFPVTGCVHGRNCVIR